MAMFTIGTKTFLSRKMNAEDQWHCFRRLAPLVKSYTAIQAQLASAGAARPPEPAQPDPMAGLDLPVMLGAAGPLADAIAGLSDADSNYVIGKCLEHTSIRQGESIAPLRTDGLTMFQDLSLFELLMICWHVLKESLGSFFDDLSSTFGKRASTAPGMSP